MNMTDNIANRDKGMLAEAEQEREREITRCPMCGHTGSTTEFATSTRWNVCGHYRMKGAGEPKPLEEVAREIAKG